MTKQLTRESAIAIIRWYDLNGQKNWGGWSAFPNLNVGASYLQYDTNPCQINLDELVEIDGELFNCITAGRPVGAKWWRGISFTELRRWCLPEEQKKIDDASDAAMTAGYNQAMASFNSLPDSVRTELLALTLEHCGSGRKRQRAIHSYIGSHGSTIDPVISPKHVRQILDCIHFNHKYFHVE